MNNSKQQKFETAVESNTRHLDADKDTLTESNNAKAINQLHVQSPTEETATEQEVANNLEKESETTNTFVFRHEDTLNDKQNCRSIFDVHNHHLLSSGNQRPRSQLNEAEIDLLLKQSSKNSQPSLLSYHGHNFLPQLVFPAEAFTSKTENSLDAEGSSLSKEDRISQSVLEKRRKSRLLYDYRDSVYLEKSRRARRRKQSEVDIEVASRLSRYVNSPYEGSVDKYSHKSKRILHERLQQPKKHFHSSRSADASPSGSTETLSVLPLTVSNNLSEYSEEEVRDYLRSKRGHRRRSLSASPPRVTSLKKSHLTSHYKNSLSSENSPSISPPTSQGPSSPALQRYRKSTFITILNAKKPGGSLLFDKEKTLPPIERSIETPSLDQKKFEDYSFLNPLSTALLSAKYRKRGDTVSEFETCTFSSCNMTKGMNKNGIQGPTKGRETPQSPSPGSLRKHVLLNTSLPCGSPTFQRAMKGLKPKDESKTTDIKNGVGESTVKPQKLIRTSSDSGRRRPYRRSTPTPLSLGKKTSRNKATTFKDSSQISCDHYDETMTEALDKLGDLDTNDKISASPRKSILKNRRRSIDDLDLAMYLKSKQNQSNLTKTNVHFM